MKGTRRGEVPATGRPNERAPRGADRTWLWMPAVLVAAGIGAYLGSFRGVFLFDDVRLIVENPNIRGLAAVWSSLPGDDRPLVSLSLALDYAIAGLNPWPYHLFNLVGHLLAGLTLFGVVAGTLCTPRFKGAVRDGARGFGFVVALLWVLHPLQTASVTYVIQRAESMMGLFCLLTFYCVMRGAASRRPAPWYGAAVIVCALGMGTKASMVTVPVLVLIYDRVFLSGSMADVFRRRRALHAGLFGTLAVLGATGIVGLVLNPARSPDQTLGLGYAGSTPVAYALTQPGVIVHYLRLALWPDPLCLDYGWPLATSARAIAPPLVLIGALLAATIASFRRRPELGFVGAWFFLLLAPTSSVIPVADAAFEHRMYLPLAAVIVIVAAAFRWLVDRAGDALRLPQAARGAALAAAVLVAACACGAVTIRRQRDYASLYAMWGNVVRQRPENPRARTGLGIALEAQGKLEEAIAQYRDALRLKGDYVDAHTNLGNALAAQGKLDEAIAHLREAIRLRPRDAGAHRNLGNALVAQGKLEDAVAHYRDALRLDPGDGELHNSLGIALTRQGKLEDAVAQYRDALRLDRDNGDVHNNLGVALAAQGRLDDAIPHFRDAIRAKESDGQAHTNLGMALAQVGRFDQAIPELRRALELDPGNATARSHLAEALQKSGRPE